jgi:hypothetical protein
MSKSLAGGYPWKMGTLLKNTRNLKNTIEKSGQLER